MAKIKILPRFYTKKEKKQIKEKIQRIVVTNLQKTFSELQIGDLSTDAEKFKELSIDGLDDFKNSRDPEDYFTLADLARLLNPSVADSSRLSKIWNGKKRKNGSFEGTVDRNGNRRENGSFEGTVDRNGNRRENDSFEGTVDIYILYMLKFRFPKLNLNELLGFGDESKTHN